MGIFVVQVCLASVQRIIFAVAIVAVCHFRLALMTELAFVPEIASST